MWKWYTVWYWWFHFDGNTLLHMLSPHQTTSHFQYANKWRRPLVTCWRQRRPIMRPFHKINSFTYSIWLQQCTYRWYALYLGLVVEGKGIDISYWNKPPYLEHNPACVPSLYISLTNTPYLPVVHSAWHKDIFNTTKEKFEWIGTKYIPTCQKDSDDIFPSFL